MVDRGNLLNLRAFLVSNPHHALSPEDIKKVLVVRVINTITLVLLIVGGLNWASVGLLDLDLVAALFGDTSLLSRLVYTLVGASALWQLIPLLRGDEGDLEAAPHRTSAS